jgi:hypothetical protein
VLGCLRIARPQSQLRRSDLADDEHEDVGTHGHWKTDYVFASAFKKDRLEPANIWRAGFEFVDSCPDLGAGSRSETLRYGDRDIGRGPPQVQVSIKNVATGNSKVVRANSHGFYTAPNLLPGTYEMTASVPGFATEVRSGVTLTVGAKQLLDLTMHVRQVTETAQVTGEAATVQLTTSSISAIDHATGQTLATFGQPGHQVGGFDRIHCLAVTSKGDIITAETTTGRRVQIFRLVSN